MPSGIFDRQHIANEQMCSASWNGKPNGERFRCSLCGHKFLPGDGFYRLMTNTRACADRGVPPGNPFVCAACSSTHSDVYEQLALMQKEWAEIKQRFWWFLLDVEAEAQQAYENELARTLRRYGGDRRSGEDGL